MIRSLAGRGLACLALLGLLSSWAFPVRAEFSGDSCLGAFEQPVRAGGTNGARFVVTGDLDGDGDIDVVTASAGDDRIAWFENVSGIEDDPALPPPWSPEFFPTTISANADGATAVFVEDIDGDGTLDVLSASANDNKIAWYRNNGRADPKFGEFEISTDAALAQAVFAADVNGDGNMDVLSASFSDNKIAWYENDGGNPPNFTEHAVTRTAMGASSVYAADVDGDGDVDVVSASILDDKVAWFEQEPSALPDEPPLFTEHVIATSGTVFVPPWDAMRPVSVVAADLDGNCATVASGTPCMDVLVAFNGNGIDTGKITWFRNDGMDPPEFVPDDIKEDLTNARQVFALAPAGDVLAAYEDTIAWYPNDGDGENPPAFGTEWIVSDTALGAMSVHAADLDGDGITDVQSASSVPGVRISDDKIVWYRNDGMDPPLFAENDISLNSASPESIFVADIDGDCDPASPETPCLDVVSASSADDTVAWHRNDGPPPPRGVTQDDNQTPSLEFAQIDIDKDADGVWSVFVADLDASCDPAAPLPAPCLDVIAAAPGDGFDGKIVWYQNDGQYPPTFTDHVILQGAEDMGPPTEPPTSLNAKPMSVFAADVNGDCDPDAPAPCIDVIAAIRVAAEDVPDQILWFENDGGDPPNFTTHVISSNLGGPRAVHASDLDSDGYMDVLVASTDDNRITWFRNLKGEEEQPTTDPPEWREIVVTNLALGAMWVSVADLDGDCVDGVESYCKELLSASSADNKIAWYDVEGPEPRAEPMVAWNGSGAPESAPAILQTGPVLQVDPSTLDFGSVFAGQIEPATLAVLITNRGDETLEISSIASTAAEFFPSETALTLAANSSQEISVTFIPSALAIFSGTLEFTSNAVNQPPPAVEMTGAGFKFATHVVAIDRFFARFVSTGDVDKDDRIDILAASSGDGVIAAYLQQEIDPEAEEPELTFQEMIISPAAGEARTALVTDLNADGSPDVATAYFFEISWHEGNVIESCNSFDADGDGRMAGAELSWIWTSFGKSFPGKPEDNPEWWERVDFNKDGLIDGDDLAIGTSLGVWTRFVSPQEGDPQGPLCNFSCASQD